MFFIDVSASNYEAASSNDRELEEMLLKTRTF